MARKARQGRFPLGGRGGKLWESKDNIGPCEFLWGKSIYYDTESMATPARTRRPSRQGHEGQAG